jgi:hypothetical protein
MDRPLPPSDAPIPEKLLPSAPAEDLVTPTVLQALETADRLIERSLADGTRA